MYICILQLLCFNFIILLAITNALIVLESGFFTLVTLQKCSQRIFIFFKLKVFRQSKNTLCAVTALKNITLYFTLVIQVSCLVVRQTHLFIYVNSNVKHVNVDSIALCIVSTMEFHYPVLGQQWDWILACKVHTLIHYIIDELEQVLCVTKFI